MKYKTDYCNIKTTQIDIMPFKSIHTNIDTDIDCCDGRPLYESPGMSYPSLDFTKDGVLLHVVVILF